MFVLQQVQNLWVCDLVCVSKSQHEAVHFQRNFCLKWRVKLHFSWVPFNKTKTICSKVKFEQNLSPSVSDNSFCFFSVPKWKLQVGPALSEFVRFIRNWGSSKVFSKSHFDLLVLTLSSKFGKFQTFSIGFCCSDKAGSACRAKSKNINTCWLLEKERQEYWQQVMMNKCRRHAICFWQCSKTWESFNINKEHQITKLNEDQCDAVISWEEASSLLPAQTWNLAQIVIQCCGIFHTQIGQTRTSLCPSM